MAEPVTICNSNFKVRPPTPEPAQSSELDFLFTSVSAALFPLIDAKQKSKFKSRRHLQLLRQDEEFPDLCRGSWF